MYYFIINPSASSGKGNKIWNQVENMLKREDILYEAHILKNGEDAVSLVKSLTGYASLQEKTESSHNKEIAATQEERDCHLVVLGGDGTLNAVLNGIEDFEHTIVSCIRTGSGNDFARNIRINKDVEKALHGILHNQEEMILDYGEICYFEKEQEKGQEEPHSKRFMISSGVGYDADICEEVSRSALKKQLNRFHLGKLVYVAIGIKQIFTRKITKAVICMDDKEPISIPKLFFVVGMIHPCEGGGVPFCPEADALDGLLDVCLVKNMPKWKLLLAVMLVYGKKHFLFRNITGHRCKRMEITTEQPQWFHMDGETPCQINRVVMECKSGLRFQK